MHKAVIDMGTNSTRLAVGSLQDGTLKMEFTQVLETRLGEGMGTERIIKPEPLQRNVDAVRQFVQQAEAMGVESLRITATSAVRDAANKQQVQQAIEAAAGMKLEILPGETEARLSYLGASGDFLNLHPSAGSAGYRRRQHRAGVSGAGRHSRGQCQCGSSAAAGAPGTAAGGIFCSAGITGRQAAGALRADCRWRHQYLPDGYGAGTDQL